MNKAKRLTNTIRSLLDQREKKYLSPLAWRNDSAVRRHSEPMLENGYRQSFGVDADRIINSLAYTRYIDKTQVFSLIKNDHLTHRVLHVQLCSKIARTIGRFLGLNEDLIEAIALGHDIGHTPFGHDGERILSEICRSCGIGHFEHNAQSVIFLDRVERKGRGWNLSLQTLDGILCHNGEIHNKTLTPCRNKTFDTLDRELGQTTAGGNNELTPMTLEGCVVRISDTISYIGRDIEDAIRLDLISRSEIPAKCAEIIGSSNGTIVHNLVTDIISCSFQKPFISFSDEISDALLELKKFNMERIYLNKKIKSHLGNVKDLFGYLFERFLSDIEKDNRRSVIFTHFLKEMDPSYTANNNSAEIVRDFIAGMTDRYFIEQCPENLRPKPVVI